MDLDEIKKITRGTKIKIIESTAHCFGGKYKNKILDQFLILHVFHFKQQNI